MKRKIVKLVKEKPFNVKENYYTVIVGGICQRNTVFINGKIKKSWPFNNFQKVVGQLQDNIRNITLLSAFSVALVVGFFSVMRRKIFRGSAGEGARLLGHGKTVGHGLDRG